MMTPQCSTCGTYFTGNETFCARCGTARVANPYQNPYGQPVQQQPNAGNWFQRYYTPQRIVRRMIIGRIIGVAIVVLILGACALCIVLGGLASVLGSH